jgi:hypothetical protein
MHSQADKKPDSKTETANNLVTQRQKAGLQAPYLTDNRPASVGQRKLIQRKENNAGLPDQLKTGGGNLSANASSVAQRVVLPGLFDSFGEEVDTEYMLLVHNYIVNAIKNNNEEAIALLIARVKELDPGKLKEVEENIRAVKIVMKAQRRHLASMGVPADEPKSKTELPTSSDEHVASSSTALVSPPEDEERWNQLKTYIELTIAMPGKESIKKVEGFDATKLTARLGGPLSPLSAKIAQQYIDQFQIISRKEFDGRLDAIAEGIMGLGKYSCIVSEVGKSNFWVTGKVLAKVKQMGGKPPTRVISVPVKEKGMADKKEMGILAQQLKDAGHIVFLDDGSYSGSQLVNLINKVIGGFQIDHSIGLVALSDTAGEKLLGRDRDNPTRMLGRPIGIPTYKGGDLNAVHRELGIPVHREIADKEMEPEDGNSTLGLYYKVPDYASVRTKLLTGDKGRPGPVEGYAEGSGTFVKVHGANMLVKEGGSEPYKSKDFISQVAKHSKSLADLGIESPPAPAKRSGFGRLKFID